MRLLIPAAISLAAAAQSLPSIDILYPDPNGSILDANCGIILKAAIQPALVREAVKRAPEFQALWDRSGREYLTTTFAEIGLAFPYKEMQATLTVCPGLTTMSSPLIVNVSNYLPSSEDRLPDEHFVEQLYHEIMHNYVRQVRDRSALRRKYSNEPQPALSHLHVAALEKFVLLKLHKTDELKRVANDYETSKTPGYRRAWEIVNQIEGHQPFIDELKKLAQ